MNQYAIEDIPDMTNPDVAVDIWHQTAAAMVNFGEESRAALAANEAALGALYQQADSTGDETAKAHVMTAWHKTQLMAAQVQQLDGAMVSAMVAVELLAEHRQAVIGELESLTEAIEEADIYDPRLGDFVEVITEITEENAREWASELAGEHLFGEIDMALRSYTQRFSVVSRIMDILTGDDLVPGEEEALRAFVTTIAALTKPTTFETETDKV